jgi:predicted small secreted protein
MEATRRDRNLERWLLPGFHEQAAGRPRPPIWRASCNVSGRPLHAAAGTEELMRDLRIALLPTAALVATMLVSGCANTAQGVKVDAEKATETVAAGAETVDVKAALIADGRVDASNINVDTSASTKTVVLKGTVTTAEQKALAEKIAQEQAKGYKINNTLTVAPKS